MSGLSTIIKQLERERDHLRSQLAKLGTAMALFRGPSGTGKTMAVRKGRRRLSTAARARIRAAQKARWAKWRKAHKKH